MSMKYLRRGLLLAMVVPALFTAGCAADSNGQAMKGAAASPTNGETVMPDSPMPGDSASPTDTGAAMESPRAAVESFYKALAEGDAEKAAQMFTSDGVAAVQGKQTAEGTQALTEAFEGEKVSGTPNIEESENLGKQAAFVTASVGEGGDATRGFFLLKKEGESWKISRYMSNTAG